MVQNLPIKMAIVLFECHLNAHELIERSYDCKEYSSFIVQSIKCDFAFQLNQYVNDSNIIVNISI